MSYFVGSINLKANEDLNPFDVLYDYLRSSSFTSDALHLVSLYYNSNNIYSTFEISSSTRLTSYSSGYTVLGSCRINLTVNGVSAVSLAHGKAITFSYYVCENMYYKKILEDNTSVTSEVTPAGSSFEPPTASQISKIEDLPFYQDLLANGEISSFDDLSQTEYDYLQSQIQKKEVGWFDTIINKSKELFMGSNSESYKDITISYDENVPELVAYYGDNGLDISKSYSFNMDGIRVGYKKDGEILPITTDSKVSNSGEFVVSDEVKNNFLSDGELYVPLTSASSSSGGLTSNNIGTNVGIGSTIALLNSGIIEDLADKTVDTFISGSTYLYNQAKNLYSGWTNTGNRTQDVINQNIQQGTYTKGMSTTIQGEGSNVAETTGTVTLDTTGISFPPLTLSSDLTLPNIEVDIPTDLGSIPVSIPTDLGSIPVSIPTGSKVDLDVTSKSVGLTVTDETKVKLDTEDSTLKLDGLGDVWNSLLSLLVTRITHLNSLKENEKIKLENDVSAHDLEYGENGIRTLEKGVATWRNTEYNSTVIENDIEVNKIDRDIKAWQGLHSINEDGTITDTIGNGIPKLKGIIPSILGIGGLEFIRENLIDKANDNVLAKAKAKANVDDEENENNLIDNLFSILGVKLNAPSLTDEQLNQSPELKAILEGLQNLTIQNTDN